MSLTNFRTLGHSGLVVSPLALGVMTFGAGRWGADLATARAIFDAYTQAGGNFIDTADVYAGGQSDAMLGGFLADSGLRDHIVLATKAGYGRKSGNPNAGGNGAKNIIASVEASLKRLKTDRIDLFYTHVWDSYTPAHELLATLQGLVQSGKILHYGLSSVPAWYGAQLATLAQTMGGPRPIALQFEYSLTERGIEAEHVPMAKAFGMAMVPWSPLSGGFLTGKYDRDTPRAGSAGFALPDATDTSTSGTDGRLNGANPFGDTKFTARNWDILDTLREVAHELGRPVAQTALAWVCQQSGVAAPIIGASKPEQIASNIAALDIAFTPDQMACLTSISAPNLNYLYGIFVPPIRRMVYGGCDVIGFDGSE